MVRYFFFSPAGFLIIIHVGWYQCMVLLWQTTWNLVRGQHLKQSFLWLVVRYVMASTCMVLGINGMERKYQIRLVCWPQNDFSLKLFSLRLVLKQTWSRVRLELGLWLKLELVFGIGQRNNLFRRYPLYHCMDWNLRYPVYAYSIKCLTEQ
jgi:hypothetical protein